MVFHNKPLLFISILSLAWVVFIGQLIFHLASKPENNVSPSRIKAVYDYCIHLESDIDCDVLKQLHLALEFPENGN